jgi:hypothetical protein
MTTMLYQSALTLLEIGSSTDIAKIYCKFIENVVHVLMPTARLDLYLMKSPPNLLELERILSALYNMAEKVAKIQNKEGINVTVLVDALDVDLTRVQQWDVIATSKYEMQLPKVLRSLVPETHDIHMLPVVIMDAGEQYLESGPGGVILEHPENSDLVGTVEHNVVAGKNAVESQLDIGN